MRTPEKYIDWFQENCVSSTGLSEETRKALINIVEEAQREAYNEAIDDAIKYVKIKEKSTRSNIEKTITIYIIDKESLNKLKK